MNPNYVLLPAVLNTGPAPATKSDSIAHTPRNDEIMPRFGPGLLLDVDSYDRLVETLMQDLRPPNALAESTIRLLAQEMEKLAFSQRIELSLMEQTQRIHPGTLSQLENIYTLGCGGKTREENEHELQILLRVHNAFTEDSKPDLPQEEFEWITAALWRRVTCHERRCQELTEDLAFAADDAETTPDHEKESYSQECRRLEESLEEAKAEDEKEGRAAHGIETHEDLAAVLEGSATVPADKREVWFSTLDAYIATVRERRRRAGDYAKRLADLRAEAAQNALFQIDQLTRVQQYSAGIRKNVEQCLRQLQKFGVDLKAARTCALQPVEEESLR